ncbi:hypothetical protein D3C74_264800 [compost metagenome]
MVNVKAAIYARVGNANQIAENQIEKCKRHCESIGFEFSEIYVDERFSGLDLNRPSLRKMINDASNGLFNVIISADSSRLFRLPADLLMFEHTLAQQNVKLMLVTHGEK